MKKINIKDYPSPPLISRLMPWLILALVSTYVALRFISIPYLGINFNRDEITRVYNDQLNIKIGDRILKIDGESWPERYQDLGQPLFPDHHTGDQVTLTLLSEDGLEKEITLTYQEINRKELYVRLNSEWWFTYIFWAAGTIIFLVVRPRDNRWRLIIAYMFTFSVFLAAGSVVNRYHYFGSAYITRISGWLLLAIMVHLHWDFPHPFINTPPWIKKLSLLIFYPISIFMAFYQFSDPKYYGLYQYAVALGLFLSTLFIIAHYIVQKDFRRDTRVIFYFSLIAILPFLIIFISDKLGYTFSRYGLGAAVLGLPLIPVAYVYAFTRRYLGKYELRTNRAISFYLFAILLLIVVSMISSPLVHQDTQEQVLLNIILATLTTGVLSIFLFQPFQRFIEKYVFGVSFPPEDILHHYSNVITSLTEPKELAAILTKDILPSMLIRQSALLYNYEEQATSSWLYTDSVSPPTPALEAYAQFHQFSGVFINEAITQKLPEGFEWVHLILPLQAHHQTQGIWFLGRKDPDNYYSSLEIDTLKSIANQTAVALLNHEQANSLRALYQVNIYRNEMERVQLGRELHDETLNRLANIKQRTLDEDLHEEIEEAIGHLRDIIAGLRPNLLNFGLMTAFQDLVHEFNQRMENTDIQIDISGDMSRLNDELAEQQIYRIIQQALDNATAHPECENIMISGEVKQTRVYLEVSDDGPGFELPPNFNLATLLEEKRFGLAGMYERASVIYADLNIKTAPGQGTTICLEWRANDLPQPDF